MTTPEAFNFFHKSYKKWLKNNYLRDKILRVSDYE